MIIPIDKTDIVVVAVPFLRDRDIRRAISGESFNEIETRYKKALINQYSRLADRCEEINRDSFFIAMGHLFVTNTTVSDSESSIYIGGLGDISVDDFPKIFDYIALGHLHKSQKVGDRDHIRYSGSPIPLSFNEAKRDSKVTLLDVESREIKSIDEVIVPRFRDLISIKNSISGVKQELRAIKSDSNLRGWIDIVVTDVDRDFNLNMELETLVDGLDFDILRVSLETKKSFNYIESSQAVPSLSSFTPEKIFEQKCREENFNLEENIEIKDIFYEILSEVRDEDI
jgi:exonuclease SbcD